MVVEKWVGIMLKDVEPSARLRAGLNCSSIQDIHHNIKTRVYGIHINRTSNDNEHN